MYLSRYDYAAQVFSKVQDKYKAARSVTANIGVVRIRSRYFGLAIVKAIVGYPGKRNTRLMWTTASIPRYNTFGPAYRNPGPEVMNFEDDGGQVHQDSED